jgi:hypothetical protein
MVRCRSARHVPVERGMIVVPRPVMAAYDLGTESGFPMTGRSQELIPERGQNLVEQ